MRLINILVAFLLPFLSVMGTTITATTVTTQTISVVKIIATETKYNTTTPYVASTGFAKPTASGGLSGGPSSGFGLSTSTPAMSPIVSVKPTGTPSTNAAPRLGADAGAAALVMMMVAAML
ncbi:MAG: hypothetical protein M1818_001571 [Claussenomyces sp. TS43310]|nr:MAG: hypothetical protein M1818_001571 [Claussenomyces sp. TS43310]